MDNKSSLSERDIITKYILPAIEQSGWNKQTQIREEVTFTAGRIFVKGKKTKRGEKKRADIIIYYKPNIPVAVVEAKTTNIQSVQECSKLWNTRELLIFRLQFQVMGIDS